MIKVIGMLFGGDMHRRAWSAGFAIISAFLITTTFQLQGVGWAMMGAFLMCQTTIGSPLRQGMLIFFYILLALFASLFFHTYFPTLLVEIVLSLLMIIAAYWSSIQISFYRSRLNFFVLFVMLLLIATLEPVTYQPLHDERLIASIIGILIGMVFFLLFISSQLENTFFESMLPLLGALEAYTKSMRIHPGTQTFALSHMEKIHLERILSDPSCDYPEWIFDVGFNPVLRSGFRFVMVLIDNIVETLFSLSAQFHKSCKPETVARLREPFNAVIQGNAELFAILIQYFKTKSLPDKSSDFTQDIQQLETEMQYLLPENIELLDVSPEYLVLTAIMRDIKDLRHLLLQLIAALPSS